VDAAIISVCQQWHARTDSKHKKLEPIWRGPKQLLFHHHFEPPKSHTVAIILNYHHEPRFKATKSLSIN